MSQKNNPVMSFTLVKTESQALPPHNEQPLSFLFRAPLTYLVWIASK